MKRATNSPRTPANPIRRILPALVADVALLAVFLYVALGQTSSAGSPPASVEPAAVVPEAPAPALPPARPGLGTLKANIEASLAPEGTRLGLMLRDAEGQVLMEVGSNERFVLASVAKVYIMAVFLDQLWQQGIEPDSTDLALLEDMIRYSDNDAASTLWRRIEREEGLDAFLAAKGLPPIDLTEDANSWGTMNASAAEVSELLWRLVDGSLLDPASTRVAVDLLSNIWEDQAWGISAGAHGPGEIVMLKNGWYPERDGWRVNTAGAIEEEDGFYVLVIMAYPTPGLDEGITLLEDIAWRVNAFMSRQ